MMRWCQPQEPHSCTYCGCDLPIGVPCIQNTQNYHFYCKPCYDKHFHYEPTMGGGVKKYFEAVAAGEDPIIEKHKCRKLKEFHKKHDLLVCPDCNKTLKELASKPSNEGA